MNKTCQNCNKPLPRDASYRRKFCDARCRVAHSRKPKNESGYHEAMQGITALGNQSENRNSAILCLKDLRKQIDHELRKLKDEDAIAKHEMFKSMQKKQY